MLMIASGIMIFAGILAGYINALVFYALVSAAVVQLLLGLMAKAFYTKK